VAGGQLFGNYLLQGLHDVVFTCGVQQYHHWHSFPTDRLKSIFIEG
jgi:hypothetical protein